MSTFVLFSRRSSRRVTEYFNFGLRNSHDRQHLLRSHVRGRYQVTKPSLMDDESPTSPRWKSRQGVFAAKCSFPQDFRRPAFPVKSTTMNSFGDRTSAYLIDIAIRWYQTQIRKYRASVDTRSTHCTAFSRPHKSFHLQQYLRTFRAMRGFVLGNIVRLR